MFEVNKKAQITFFIILAIVIVAALLLSFFVFKIPKAKMPELQEAETKFLECVNSKTQEALKTAGLQGGWIYLPAFESGSDFAPFSNYFFFLGLQIPYWFYISGNNIAKWQVPSKEQIEEQIALWLEKELDECKPEIANVEIIFKEKPKVTTKMYDSFISIEIFLPMQIKKLETIAAIDKHKTNVKTNFYSLYKDAIKIFEAENTSLFLENYSIDILNLYAPTTRFELSCIQKTWSKQQVFQDIKEALEVNIPMLKFKGNYYRLKTKENNYFVTDVDVKNQVNLLYSKAWPTKLEVWPLEDDMLKAYPVGTQAGLGALGLCYVAYHFVYDLSFPVLVQVSRNDEIFQFPLVVVIDKNKARQAETEESPVAIFEICNNKAQTATVFTYSQNLKPVEAEIYFKCLNQVCNIGKTSIEQGKARLTAKFPECLNGMLIAKADGFEDAYILLSSNEPFIENVFLEKNYEIELEIELQVNERAIVNFETENKKFSVFYPEQKKVRLAAKDYNITLQLFKEANLRLEAQKGEKCVTIPSGGYGLPFVPRKECFELEIPEQVTTEVVFGGGSKSVRFTAQELGRAKKLKIEGEKFNVPITIEDLAKTYEMLETAELRITLK
ncbi:MAG: hypothetical protein QXL88_00630 [Candidatus Pacearchaeota archaeon]